LGYLRAVGELVAQIDRGELPEPDVIVAAAGTGSTVAGLAAGVAREGLRSRVVGATVALPARGLAPWAFWLAQRALNREAKSGNILWTRNILDFDERFRGAGYGLRSEAGRAAAAAARQVGLSLDPTYTEKAFAAALSLVGSAPFETAPAAIAGVAAERPLRVLYWHTLSATPPADLCERAGRLDERLLPRS
jgi:1-aminocyclopropane-1-carboxylate deaminase/D-cysteine desulfhydrase-like pyridoxal-dependent ACC family enzyme